MSTPENYQEFNNKTENDFKKNIISIQVKDKKFQEENNINCHSKMISECKNNPSKLTVNIGFFTIRVPVVIAEPIIYINLEDTIELPGPATYIKHIRRKVLINKCNLIPEIGKIFLSGTVKKSLEYSEVTSSDNNILEGQIKNVTVNTPFDCTTNIEYITNPIGINKNYENNIKVYKNKDDEQIFTESYSEPEKIYGQLINVNFEELNIKTDKSTNINFEDIYTFKTIKQKMTMHLTIRLIQNQNINILSQPNK